MWRLAVSAARFGILPRRIFGRHDPSSADPVDKHGRVILQDARLSILSRQVRKPGENVFRVNDSVQICAQFAAERVESLDLFERVGRQLKDIIQVTAGTILFFFGIHEVQQGLKNWQKPPQVFRIDPVVENVGDISDQQPRKLTCRSGLR